MNCKRQCYTNTKISLANDSNSINNPNNITEHLSKHFSNIAKSIATEIPERNYTFQNYFKNPRRNTLFINQIAKEEIGEAIKLLINNKAIGPKIYQQNYSKSSTKHLMNHLSIS